MNIRPGRDRAVGFQLVIMFLFLGIAAVVITLLVDPMSMLVDIGHETAAGTEYSETGHEANDRVWTAYSALPLVASIMGLIFVLAMAVLHSSR